LLLLGGVAQFLASLGQNRTDRVFGQAELFANLAIVEKLEVIQTHHFRLALGQVFKAGGEDWGNGTSTFFNDGKPIDVTFAKDRVTAFHPD